jgi:two-component system, OmpR family, alkaline phosphatase synthesis response regulator PhoP
MSEGPLILVADDDEDIVTLVRIRLEGAGYRVVTASNGERALDLARSERPSLAVLDAMMPQLDGYGVVRAVRADPELAGMRVLMLSARVHADDIGRGLDAGADEYLAKPFRAARLLEVVRELLAG